MSTYSLRCRVDACRHRRVSKTHPDEYKITPPCPVCGSTKGWRIENRDYNKRNLCRCNGPIGRDGPIPHKTSHPFCDQHPRGIYNQLRREGVPEEEIPLEYLGTPMKETDETPF